MIKTNNNKLNDILGGGFEDGRVYSFINNKKENNDIMIQILKTLPNDIKVAIYCSDDDSKYINNNSNIKNITYLNGDYEISGDVLSGYDLVVINRLLDVKDFSIDKSLHLVKIANMYKDLARSSNIPIITTLFDDYNNASYYILFKYFEIMDFVSNNNIEDNCINIHVTKSRFKETDVSSDMNMNINI